MFDQYCTGAAVVRDYCFPDILAYKRFLSALRMNAIDFYILQFGPGSPEFRCRIAFRLESVPMLDIIARCNFDPIH